MEPGTTSPLIKGGSSQTHYVQVDATVQRDFQALSVLETCDSVDWGESDRPELGYLTQSLARGNVMRETVIDDCCGCGVCCCVRKSVMTTVLYLCLCRVTVCLH